MIRVGICGGIGSGKSTVCRMFAERGVAVYVADERAKGLMNDSKSLREAIVGAFGAECYREGVLDRVYLAGRVFGCEEQLARLNAIVHPAVKEDFVRWASEQSGDYVIIEAAILFEAQFDDVVDVTVAVLAPRSLRLARAMERDGVSCEKIEQRMAAQCSDEELVGRADFSIVNISLEDIQKDVAELDYRFRAMAARMRESNNEQ